MVCTERRRNGEHYLRQPKPDLLSTKFRSSALPMKLRSCDTGQAESVQFSQVPENVRRLL